MLFILWYDYTPNLYFWQVIKHNFVCLHHFFWKSESDESILSADKNCLTEKDMIEAEKLTAEEAAAELERIAKETRSEEHRLNSSHITEILPVKKNRRTGQQRVRQSYPSVPDAFAGRRLFG